MLSPSSSLVSSISGWPRARRSLVRTASEYARGSASCTASSRTAARPTRWSMIRAGALPGRKPGTRTCLAMFAYALSRLGLSSSKGTSTASRTLVGLRVSTVLFNALVSSYCDGGTGHRGGGRRAGRGGGIRTHGPSLPKRVRYQAAPHPGTVRECRRVRPGLPLRWSVLHAGVAQWQSPSLPSWPCGFDSRHPLSPSAAGQPLCGPGLHLSFHLLSCLACHGRAPRRSAVPVLVVVQLDRERVRDDPIRARRAVQV